MRTILPGSEQAVLRCVERFSMKNDLQPVWKQVNSYAWENGINRFSLFQNRHEKNLWTWMFREIGSLLFVSNKKIYIGELNIPKDLNELECVLNAVPGFLFQKTSWTPPSSVRKGK